MQVGAFSKLLASSPADRMRADITAEFYVRVAYGAFGREFEIEGVV